MPCSSSRLYGSLMGLLTTMKGLPLAYNKDMQEDKEPVFDAVDTVKMCLPVFTGMLATMRVLPARSASFISFFRSAVSFRLSSAMSNSSMSSRRARRS